MLRFASFAVFVALLAVGCASYEPSDDSSHSEPEYQEPAYSEPAYSEPTYSDPAPPSEESPFEATPSPTSLEAPSEAIYDDAVAPHSAIVRHPVSNSLAPISTKSGPFGDRV